VSLHSKHTMASRAPVFHEVSSPCPGASPDTGSRTWTENTFRIINALQDSVMQQFAFGCTNIPRPVFYQCGFYLLNIKACVLY